MYYQNCGLPDKVEIVRSQGSLPPEELKQIGKAISLSKLKQIEKAIGEGGKFEKRQSRLEDKMEPQRMMRWHQVAR